MAGDGVSTAAATFRFAVGAPNPMICPMVGALINSAGIVLGGGLALVLKKPLSATSQTRAKVLLGVFTVWFGLTLTLSSLNGSAAHRLKQLAIVLLAMALGKLAGKLLRLQKLSNAAGQFATREMATAASGRPEFNAGFRVATALFCAAPLAVLGSVAEGLDPGGFSKLLVVKAVMDGMATMAFSKTFGRGVMVSAIPVLAWEGAIIRCAALLRPIEESERRIAAMKQTVVEAGRSVRELGYLFMAEQQSISDLFLKRRKAFLSAVTPLAVEHFGLVVDAVPRTAGPAYRRHLMQQAQEIAQRHVLPWLRLEQEEGENQYRLVARRFQQMGNEFLTRLADAGIPELAAMPHALEAETGFRTRSRFSFLELIEQAQPASPLRWFADLFLGLVGAHAVIAREAVQFLNQLLETNSSRVQGDILNRVLESRGRLEAEIRKLLHQVSHMAERALVNARKVCDEGTPAVESALLRLDSLEARIKEAAGKKFDAS